MMVTQQGNSTMVIPAPHYVWEVRTVPRASAEDRNYSPVNYQKYWATNSWSSARYQHCLFCNTTDRWRALKLPICVIFRYSNYQCWVLSVNSAWWLTFAEVTSRFKCLHTGYPAWITLMGAVLRYAGRKLSCSKSGKTSEKGGNW